MQSQRPMKKIYKKRICCAWVTEYRELAGDQAGAAGAAVPPPIAGRNPAASASFLDSAGLRRFH